MPPTAFPKREEKTTGNAPEHGHLLVNPPKNRTEITLSEIFYKVFVNTISDDLQETRGGKGPRGASSFQ